MLRGEQTRQLTPAEAVGWLADYGAVFGAALARRGYLSPRTAPAYRRLQDDAARMIELARDEPSADVRALEEQQTHRRLALKVSVPEPPGIVGRIGQTLRRSLPPYRPAPSRACPVTSRRASDAEQRRKGNFTAAEGYAPRLRARRR